MDVQMLSGSFHVTPRGWGLGTMQENADSLATGTDVSNEVLCF